MPALTIRDLPDELHKELKESAERNRRSLNGEIIMRLEQSIRSDFARARTSEEVDEWMERMRKSRESRGFTSTDEEIREAIREGRP